MYSAGALARAHVNVHVHGLVCRHAVNVHVYVYAKLHNLFFYGALPQTEKNEWNKCKNHLNEMKWTKCKNHLNEMKGMYGCHFMKKKGTRRTYTKQITHP